MRPPCPICTILSLSALLVHYIRIQVGFHSRYSLMHWKKTSTTLLFSVEVRLKLMGLKWLLFLSNPLLLGYETHNKYEMVSISKWKPLSSGFSELICIGILFIIKVKILVLIKWSYASPQLCERRTISFEHMAPFR